MRLPWRTDDRDWWIPGSFFGLFAVVLIANGALAFFAFNSWTGLTVTDSYEKGRAFNETLDRAAAQKALGWRLSLRVDPISGGTSDVSLDLRDRGDREISDAVVLARFLRPTHEGHDVTATLLERGSGHYGARVVLPLPGQWLVELEIDRNGRIHRSTRRIEVR